MIKPYSNVISFIKAHIQSALVTNSAWIVFEQIYKMGLSLVIGVLTARYLGPSNMGIITYASTYINAFLPFATLSMEYVVIKDIVEHPEKSGEIMGSGILMRMIAGMISMAMILGIVTSLKSGDEIYFYVSLLNSITLVAGSLTLVDSWLQAQLKSKYATIIKSIGYTCMSFYKVYLMIMKKSIIWFAFAASLDAIIIAILYGYFLIVKGNVKLKVSRTHINHLLRQSFPFILTGIMIVIYGQIDRIFLDYYHGERALGLYGVGSNLSYMWQFIPAAVITSARPIILNAKNSDTKLYMKRIKQLYAFIWWLSVLVSLLFTVFGDLIVQILYEEEFADAAIILKIITWSQGFSLLGGARSIWLLAENKNKYLIPSQFISAIFSVAINFILIPPFGAVGAAISMVLTQAFVALISTLFVKKIRESSRIMISSIILRNIE